MVKGSFDILNDISENFTLVKLMGTVGNLYHEVSILGYWILNSNNKNSFSLKINLLNILCSPLGGGGTVCHVEKVFYSARYINNRGKLNILIVCQYVKLKYI